VYRQLTTGGYHSIPVPLHQPTVCAVDWTKSLPLPPEGPSPPYDVILLTDCVFSASLVPYLVATIWQCCGPRSEILCVHEIRDEEANAAFLLELSNQFIWKRLPRSKLHPEYRNELIEVILAKPKPVHHKK